LASSNLKGVTRRGDLLGVKLLAVAKSIGMVANDGNGGDTAHRFKAR
jgi:hypothetical protein